MRVTASVDAGKLNEVHRSLGKWILLSPQKLGGGTHAVLWDSAGIHDLAGNPGPTIDDAFDSAICGQRCAVTRPPGIWLRRSGGGC